MAKTQLKKLTIEKFRALRNIEIEFGDHITVICGKNGTSKSSILGIVAQIFSFDKDYVSGQKFSFKTISGGPFKSKPSEHFRFSDHFDIPGSMRVNIELNDGYTDKFATARLELMKRAKIARPVIRSNSTAVSNTSRNFTHPIIFLSLKRLYPIADRDYTVRPFDYLQKHAHDFIGLTNELLNRKSAHVTSTGGIISSAVSYGDDYDQDSVSAGEDNAGQIILALMSFRKLKEEYNDYKGGILLIDEADASLFPTAQVNLLKIFERECKELNLQIIMTSHSPVLIEYAFEQSQKFRKKYKTVYLSNTFGNVQVMQDWSWVQISADINTKTISPTAKITLPKVNIYFEDKEAVDFYKALMHGQPINKYVYPLVKVTLGCSNYLELIKKKVPEFAERSVICLDADVADLIRGKNHKTIALLPGELPPDQLIFQHLYNLPANDDFWQNGIQFTRDVFTNTAVDVIRKFAIHGDNVDIQKQIAGYQDKQKVRDIFKHFYKALTDLHIVEVVAKPYNPWKHWVENNPKASNKFLVDFNAALKFAMSSGFAVEVSKLAALAVKLRKG